MTDTTNLSREEIIACLQRAERMEERYLDLLAIAEKLIEHKGLRDQYDKQVDLAKKQAAFEAAYESGDMSVLSD